MKKLFVVAALALLAGTTGSAIAGDAAAGKTKYAMCVGCHGPTGAGNAAAGYPKLAGQDSAVFTSKLTAYRDKTNPQTPTSATMNAMSASLTDADIANLAAYVATLK